LKYSFPRDQLTSFGLYSQTLAAFCAACVEHITATTGSHTSAEAVRTLAANDGRLVSTFHVGLAKKQKKCKIGSDVPSVFGANDISRTYANYHGTSWVHLIAR
jgi:hypothetical protein